MKNSRIMLNWKFLSKLACIQKYKQQRTLPQENLNLVTPIIYSSLMPLSNRLLYHYYNSEFSIVKILQRIRN